MKIRLLQAAVFVGMLIIFYFFLRYITQERLPSSDGFSAPPRYEMAG